MLTFVRQEPRRTFSGALVKLGSRMGSTTFGSMGSLALWTSVNVAPFSSNIDDSLRSETVEIPSLTGKQSKKSIIILIDNPNVMKLRVN